MVVLRFYSQDVYLEPLAKYVSEKDPGKKKIQGLCKPLIAGLANIKDAHDVMNARLTDLDKSLIKAGFERVELISTTDYDDMSKGAYDIVMNPNEKTITVLTFDIEMVQLDTGGEQLGKKLRSKEVLGQVQT